MLNRRAIVRTLGAVPLLAAPKVLRAQGATLRILHGSNPGAPQDVMLRLLAEEWQGIARHPVIVDARPGASGQVAMAMLKQLPADGRTVFSDGTGITSILQLPTAQHRWTDFEPLYRLQLDPFALYVKQGSHAGLDAFFEAMRKRPGALRIGGFALGGPHQIAMLRASRQAGTRFSWIPFDSGARAITAVMGGHLEASMSNISVYETFRERTAVLAHTGQDRLERFSEIPTFRESGVNVVAYHWRGMFLRRGTPDAVTAALFDQLGAVVRSERFRAYLRESATIDGTMPRQEFAAMLEQQATADAEVLREIGLLS
ncbi:tripartite tricarboxylate transporter substrate binding protein [Roseomonas xinghualingensis]|uniref:tripartite tricarboxylate transporter substrate binding protein n=1 Tax=Roseomonas xinghualingensis TaxID=2986475 RepID=UPI0021F1235C|nr:tripartite tricarboxylate transporter substrate binding protein [Roseomonas sp. SXEYE001]MCV4210225.1 tripartite tricarboxylate transporter substrate binding protein [Roseomonas sp. SXEYE001]